MSRTDHHPVGSTAKYLYRDRLEHRTNHFLCRRNVMPKRKAIAEQMIDTEPVIDEIAYDEPLWDWEMFLNDDNEYLSETEAEQLAWDRHYEEMTAHDNDYYDYDRRYEVEDDDERPWMESMSITQAYRELGDSFTVTNPAHIEAPERVKCESMRVYEIAALVGVESSVVVKVLREQFHEYVRTAGSAVVMPVAKAVIEGYFCVDLNPEEKAKPVPIKPVGTQHPMRSYPTAARTPRPNNPFPTPRPGNNPFVTH